MIKEKCKQCGSEFTLNDSEIEFFKSKNLNLPKRCIKCRKENRDNNKNNNINSSYNKSSNNYNKGNNYNNNKNNNYHKNNNGKKTFRNIMIAAVVFVLLLLGKIFNIAPNFIDPNSIIENEQGNISLEFRNAELLEDHFIKHGSEFGYNSKEEYLKGANKVINSSASKQKKEAEDGDNIYYDESKNEIVFVSMDGYIRTYFKPKDGIEYFNRQ